MRTEEKEPVGPARRSQGFLGHAATYATANIARRAVGFLMLPIYTRYLTPADYGVVGLLTFALALFEPIFGARLARAIPKFYLEVTDARSKRAVIWGALGLSAAVSAVTVLALFLSRGAGAQLLFGNRNYALVFGLFATNLLTQPVEETGMMYIRLQERSKLFLCFSMLKLLLQVSLNLLLVVHWRGGVLGVVEGGVISSTLIGMVLTIYVALYERPAFEWGLTRRMLQFCWPLWLSGFAGLYIGSSGAMYLRVFGSLAAVGLLELGLKFATVVDMLIWNPFWQHWEPMSYRYYREAGRSTEVSGGLHRRFGSHVRGRTGNQHLCGACDSPDGFAVLLRRVNHRADTHARIRTEQPQLIFQFQFSRDGPYKDT